MPHSHNNENTVLDLLQELHTLFYREELSTLLQVQRQGEWQKSGTAAGGQGVSLTLATLAALKAEVAAVPKLPCWDMTGGQAAHKISWLCKGSFCPAVFQGCQQCCLVGCSTYGNDLIAEKSFKNPFTEKETVHYSRFHTLVVAQVEEALLAQKWHKAIKVSNIRTLLHSLSPSYMGDLTQKLTKSIYPFAV